MGVSVILSVSNLYKNSVNFNYASIDNSFGGHSTHPTVRIASGHVIVIAPCSVIGHILYIHTHYT